MSAQQFAVAQSQKHSGSKTSIEENVLSSGEFNVFIYKIDRYNAFEGKSWVVVDGLKYVPVGRGVLGAFHLNPGLHQIQIRPFYDDHAHLNFDISVKDGENMFFELITGKTNIASIKASGTDTIISRKGTVTFRPVAQSEAVSEILGCCKYRHSEDI